ncbi:hypothetical protein [Roseivirga misakiensis]|uniref:Uncharacterized protein n=1 Tax=Roseivirga misakiensis TaxID=1563681 RepID=A0A1E5T355_9BACT|nr:hypothetical protein [Roseivirga misakiensis]OEK05810.1 hypothetical protein BFP71_06735 [Roseivirga misakiensis]
MKKDIHIPEVTGVKICIAKSTNPLGESEWHVYMVNRNLIELTNVMIVSKGYESLEKDARKTSTLRHLVGTIEQQSVAKVEPISPEVFSFYNEFWVSYYIVNEMFDKKFVIAPFQEFELEEIEELELLGKTAT